MDSVIVAGLHLKLALFLKIMITKEILNAIEEKAKEYESKRENYIQEGNKEEVMYMIGRVTGLWEAVNIIHSLWKEH